MLEETLFTDSIKSGNERDGMFNREEENFKQKKPNSSINKSVSNIP